MEDESSMEFKGKMKHIRSPFRLQYGDDQAQEWNGVLFTSESRISAGPRARFRYNRVMTNTVRNRLHDRFNITNCTHPTCLEQSKHGIER